MIWDSVLAKLNSQLGRSFQLTAEPTERREVVPMRSWWQPRSELRDWHQAVDPLPGKREQQSRSVQQLVIASKGSSWLPRLLEEQRVTEELPQ